MDYLILIGRILFVGIFFTSAPGNFKKQKAEAAGNNGVPFASLLVPLGNTIAVLGASSILLGIEARYGAWLIIIFLLPVTFTMHRFWTIDDATKRRAQYLNFMKNLSIIGGALFISVIGSGTLSLDTLW